MLGSLRVPGIFIFRQMHALNPITNQLLEMMEHLSNVCTAHWRSIGNIFMRLMDQTNFLQGKLCQLLCTMVIELSLVKN